MTETPTIVPIWRYLADEYTESAIAEIHLLIWPGGVCVAGFLQNGTPMIIQTYLTRDKPDTDWVKHLCTQDILIKNHTKKVKKIWLSEERNLLIPNSIYEENHAESWLRKFHFLSPEDILLHFELNKQVNAKIIFPISESLKAFLTETFSKASFLPLSKMAFQPISNKESAELQIISLPREIILSLSQKGHFVYHLVYPYESPQNIIYKLALILDEKGIPQEQLPAISFTGIAPFWNNILTELPAYFPLKTISENTTEITLDFLKKLFTCAS